MSETDPLTLEHSCVQCKEAVVNIRRVALTCPNDDVTSSVPFMRLTINVTVPRQCQCEACSSDDVISLLSAEQ